MIASLTNHLWQSTLFALAAALLTLAFRNSRAAVRYWIWLGGSLKFLLPFSILIDAGSHLRPAPHPQAISPAPISVAVVQFTQPFRQVAGVAAPTPHPTNWLPLVLAVWACGLLTIVAIRCRAWLGIRAAIRAGAAVDIAAPLPVHSTPELLEPGVVGLFRPLLLVPADIKDRLTPAQLAAVIAHETQHVNRRDNLNSALHMVVETLFWFHPMVWWIGARLIAEREKACDEAVLTEGHEPDVYAEGIIRICRGYVSSPLPCASGVSGADMKKRIQSILTGHVPQRLTLLRKSLLAAVTVAATSAPIVIGIINGPALRAQFRSGSAPRFAAAFIKPCGSATLEPGRSGRGGGASLGSTPVSVDAKGNFILPEIPARLFVSCATPRDLIQAAYVTFAGGHEDEAVVERPDRFPVEGPAWIASDGYSIDATPDSAQNQDTLNGPMLQGLLEDRFQLKVHRETRQVQGYAITVASSGFKAPAFRPGECLPINFGQFKAAANRARFAGWLLEPAVPRNYCPNGGGGLNPSVQIQARGVTVDEFVNTFLLFAGKPVANRTGIRGLYDFQLQFAADDPVNNAIAALDAQLGLKAEPAILPQEVLVVDSIQQPTEGAASRQTDAAFEVASVKPSAQIGPNDRVYFGPPRGGPGSNDPRRITWAYAALRSILMAAYNVQTYQIVAPDWLATTRYDIEANVPEGATREQVPAMWQKLLQERFGLVPHHQSKDFQVYELTIARGGSKLKATDLAPNPDPMIPVPGPPTPDPPMNGYGAIFMIHPDGKIHLKAKALTIPDFAGRLGGTAQMPVIDKTGLTGRYDFILDYAVDLSQFPPPPGSPPRQSTPVGDNNSMPGPDLASALEKQLGLKLTRAKASLDVIVIDHAEKVPSPN